MRVCLLLLDLYYYVVFPRGQLLVMDLHPTEHPGPDIKGISEDFFFFFFNYRILSITFILPQLLSYVKVFVSVT